MYAAACGQSQPPDLKLHYERTIPYEPHKSTLPRELCADCCALCGAASLSGTAECMLSNAIGFATGLNPAGFIDIFFGSAATLIAALLAYMLRNVKIKGFPVLSTIPPVIVNGIIVGAELTFFESNPFNFTLYGINFLSVSAGQVLPCMGVGLFLYFILRQFKLDTRLFGRQNH